MAVKFLKNEQRQQADDGLHLPITGQMVIGLLFLVALVAFEIFNFDTTQYALEHFLGQASFVGLGWATVLAIAFCAIDFAGLVRFFLPENKQSETPVGVWYLMGAWLLGATMNALMTWWAVSLTLLDHNLGNEVLSRQQILEIVPIFVAVLVWLTRILFIGAFTVAGGYLFDVEALGRTRSAGSFAPQAARQTPAPIAVRARQARPRRQAVPAGLRPVKEEAPKSPSRPAEVVDTVVKRTRAPRPAAPLPFPAAVTAEPAAPTREGV